MSVRLNRRSSRGAQSKAVRRQVAAGKTLSFGPGHISKLGSGSLRNRMIVNQRNASSYNSTRGPMLHTVAAPNRHIVYGSRINQIGRRPSAPVVATSPGLVQQVSSALGGIDLNPKDYLPGGSHQIISQQDISDFVNTSLADLGDIYTQERKDHPLAAQILDFVADHIGKH